MVVTIKKRTIPQTTFEGLSILLASLPLLGARCTCYNPETQEQCQKPAVIYGFSSDGAFCAQCALEQAQDDESIVDAVMLHWLIERSGGKGDEEDRATL